MENTNTIQFADDKVEWFIAVGEKFRGPFKASEVYEKLQSKEVSWIDYGFREKDAQWIRLADQPVFKSLQPDAPKPKPVMAPPPPPSQQKEETKWFLFQNEAQTGPYAPSELKRLISAGQVQESAFVWQEAFSEWKPYAQVSELKTETKVAPPPLPKAPHAPAPVAEEKSDKRRAPRKPLVAQIYVTNQSDLVSGMCRDISVGGMQVLTERSPGAVGTKIHLNVAPPKDSGIASFVAEGVVVRILEDQRGFSFRFIQITEEAKTAIEKYIERYA